MSVEIDFIDEDFLEDEAIDQLLSESDFSKVFLSLVFAGGKVGAATYDVDTCALHLLADQVEMAPEFTLIKTLIHQVEPFRIVVGQKNDLRLMQFLKDLHAPLDENVENENSDDFIVTTISRNFAFEGAKCRLLLTKLPHMAGNLSDSERDISWQSIVDFRNYCMVRAAGGLLKYLDKNRINTQLEEDSALVPVNIVSCITLEDAVYIDSSTYSGLQIFSEEYHPSVNKWGSVKEGLSLFGLYNRCRSPVGSKEMRKIFLQPTKNCMELEGRQQAVEFFLLLKNQEVSSTLGDCLKHIRNVLKILTQMRTSEVTPSNWHMLYQTVYNAMLIGDICRAQPQRITIFKKISEIFTFDLFRIASLVEKIVNFEESHNQKRFVVKLGVDEQLDEKKRLYAGLPRFMHEVAQMELDILGDDLQECSVIYLPQLGFLLAVPETDKLKENKYQIDGTLYEYIFSCNHLAHFKSENTRELDRALGDIHCEISDWETKIMNQLQQFVIGLAGLLADVIVCCGQLDCLLAMAAVAKEFNYVKPQLSSNDIIKIKKGRHPLQELCISNFVANDYLSGPIQAKMKVLTGPNASGKSIFIKQIGLILYLAHIGSYVPAELASVSLLDGIFTRIHAVESVSHALSNFMVDLNQMATALNSAHKNSLVLIDEFGRGTEATDGISLLVSSLLQWLENSDISPHVCVSTHMHILPSLLPSSPILHFQTMELMREEVVFLYRVIDGVADSSLAHHVAEREGIPVILLKRAGQISKLLNNNKPVPPIDEAAIKRQDDNYQQIADYFLELNFDDGNNVKLLFQRMEELTGTPIINH